MSFEEENQLIINHFYMVQKAIDLVSDNYVGAKVTDVTLNQITKTLEIQLEKILPAVIHDIEIEIKLSTPELKDVRTNYTYDGKELKEHEKALHRSLAFHV